MSSSVDRGRFVRCVSWIVLACLAAPLAPMRAQARLLLQRADFLPRGVPTKGKVVPTLAPGASLTFDEPDAVEGEVDASFAGGGDFTEGSTPLRAYAYAFLPLQSSSTSVAQSNDVFIAASTVPGGATESVVTAQISGTLSLHGFLFAMGICEARAAVDVEVLDVPFAGEPRLLASQRVAEYAAESGPGLSIGGGVNVGAQAGFPYVGMTGGGSIDASIQFDPALQVVHDDRAFGFTALVQRGHTIRVRVVVSTEAQTRVFGGEAIASFYGSGAGGPVLPNPFDPDPDVTTKGAENTWLSLLSPMAGSIPDLQIAKGQADVVSGSVDVGGGDFEFASVWNQSIADIVNPLSFGFLTGNEKTKKLHGHTLLDQVFTTPPLTMDLLVKGSPFMDVKNETGREDIQDPGVAALGPTITLDSDRVELADLALNRVIEENLAAGSRLASVYLPAANGGALERSTALLNALIAESHAAGLDTAEAEAFMTAASKAQGNGKYKTSYRWLHLAYLQLTRGP